MQYSYTTEEQDMSDFILNRSGYDESYQAKHYLTVPVIKEKPSGQEVCPVCGKYTVLRSGKSGEFHGCIYGCIGSPTCKSSRSKE